MCKFWGMTAYDCAEAAEALEVLSDSAQAQKPFDLVIVDRSTSGGGFGFASRLRVIYPHLPVIMATSDYLPGDATRSQDLGLAGYTTKPVRRTELLRLVQRALKAEGSMQVNAAATKAAQARTARELGGTYSILIAEDSEDNRFLLEEYLKTAPYELTFVENGKLAVEISGARTFHLILMDMQMPVMDGLTATDAIRRRERELEQKPIPIVALTANARIDDIEACKRAGCTSHLAKPISKQKLIGFLEEQLSKISVHAVSSGIVIQVPLGLEDAALRYIRSRQYEIPGMCHLLASQEFDQLRILAHNLKGTGLPYGFPELTEFGDRIESLAKEQDEAALSEQLTQLSVYIDEAVKLVNSEVQKEFS